jgi:small-conductance mechanosensitive channel
MLLPPSNFSFELPSSLPEEGLPWLLRLLATRLEQLATENAELKEQVLQQAETNRELRDEHAVLKGQKGRSVIKPSRMDHEMDKDKDDQTGGRGHGERRDSGQPAKIARLDIHEERTMAVNDVPEGSRFLGE